jgi:hypothetical protein
MGKLPARMTVRRRPVLASLLVVLVALALSACGSSHTPLNHEDNTGAGGANSEYITLGGLKYQVQLSRVLNPYKVEDAAYLTGIPASLAQLPAGQEWFGVFMLVLNPSDKPAPAATDFTLSDTQGSTYKPVALPKVNLYAYEPVTLAPGQQIPKVDSTAYYSPTQAALLLFQIPVSEFDNRPLTLTIVDPTDPTQKATVTLDV